MKKGQTKSTFVWLFAVIAGGAFLLIFFTITQAQQQYIDQQVMSRNSDLLGDLIEILTSSENTERTIPAPPQALEFNCIVGNHEFMYAQSTLRNTVPPLPVFTPKTIPTRPYKAISMELNPGQPIGQGIFFVPEGYSIPVQPNNQDVIDAINESPFQYTESENAPTIEYNKYRHSTGQIERNYGTVTYNDGETVGWVGDTMLLGALITNSSTLYSCPANNVERLLNVSYKISIERAKNINNAQNGLDQTCGGIYDVIINRLETTANSISFNPEDLERYTRNLEQVDDFIIRDVRRASCPSIY